MAKFVLALIGGLYVGLALWCALQPGTTSEKVGLVRQPGQGESEYLVIYGGLQLSLGLMFLLPLVKPSTTSTMLLVCVIVHVCLVFFRTLSFFTYSGFSSMTYQLAGGEWLILLISTATLLLQRRS